MMGFTNKLAGKGSSAIRFSLTRRLFPITTVLFVFFHAALFHFSLPPIYYVLSGVIVLTSLHFFARDTFEKGTLLKLALILPLCYGGHLLISSLSFHTHLVAISFLSSHFVGLGALYFAALDEKSRQQALEKKYADYEARLTASSELVKSKVELLEAREQEFADQIQTRDEAKAELDKLLELKEKEVEKLLTTHTSLIEQSKYDREKVIELQGSLGQAKSVLAQLKAQASEIKERGVKLQKALNYYRVEHAHQNGFIDVIKHIKPKAEQEATPIEKSEPVVQEKSVEDKPAFAEMIEKLTLSQKQYQEQYKQYQEQISVLEKQMKGKKKASDLGSAYDEHKAKAAEIKGALNDINRKIFILKKEQVEGQKQAAYV